MSTNPSLKPAQQQPLTNGNMITPTNEEARKKLLAEARAWCVQLEKPMETLLRLAWVEPAYAACMKIAVDIGLFEALGKTVDGSRHTAEQLATLTNTDPKLLERILRLLVSMGAIRQVDDDAFTATELSTSLIERSCSSAVDYRYLISNPVFQRLPSFLKETNYKNPSELLNSPWQYALQTKLSFFDWIGSNPEALDMFTNHMAGYTSQRGTWEDVYPIRERLLQHGEDVEKIKDTILVDLGGGSGHDLKRFASHFLPTAHRPCLVLQELPEVAEQAKSHGDLPATIQIVPIDLTKESPVVDSRAYFMHSVLHDWPDVEVRRILQQMHPALSQKTPGGRTPKLLLNENVLLKQGVQAQPAALDLIMMAAFASHERTEDQWKSLLESAGYRITAIFSKAGIDEAVIEAEAVEQFR